jgi:hypothetical protein
MMRLAAVTFAGLRIRPPAAAFALALVRLHAAAFAVALFAVPLVTAPVRAIAVIGLIGLLLAAVGIATRWRWPITAAAAVFLTGYAAALWVADGPVGIGGAAGFGLALLFLFQSVELARCVRHAAVGPGVVRSQIVRWIGFGAVTLAATMLLGGLGGAVAASVPAGAAPFLAAAGALGVVLALVVAMTHAPRAPGKSVQACRGVEERSSGQGVMPDAP